MKLTSKRVNKSQTFTNYTESIPPSCLGKSSQQGPHHLITLSRMIQWREIHHLDEAVAG
jgi:hypothetical protein